MELQLSILIPTLVSRRSVREELLRNLWNQVKPVCEVDEQHDSYIVERFVGEQAEVIIVEDNKKMTTGAKRNLLLSLAKGRYISFIDCDDWVANKYCEYILKAIQSNADTIGISGWISTNGTDEIGWELSKDFEDRTVIRNKVEFYERRANHLSPVKRELALQAGFPDKSNAEDKAYSEALNPLLKTEVKIPNLIYHYKFETYDKQY